MENEIGMVGTVDIGPVIRRIQTNGGEIMSRSWFHGFML
jgi:hypothetical protein